jgi:hypothetical protein
MEDEKMSEKISAVMDICKIDPWSRRFSMEMGVDIAFKEANASASISMGTLSSTS